MLLHYMEYSYGVDDGLVCVANDIHACISFFIHLKSYDKNQMTV